MMANLIEINLKLTKKPETYEYMSDVDEWVEAVLIQEKDGRKEVMLLHGDYRGKVTESWETRPAISTLWSEVVEAAKKMRNLIDENADRFASKTTVDTMTALQELDKIIGSRLL